MYQDWLYHNLLSRLKKKLYNQLQGQLSPFPYCCGLHVL